LAKKTDNRAALQTDNGGGLLSGVLAEENDFDRPTLWRLGAWGVGAVGAVVIAVVANQSSLTFRRDQIATADIVRQAQQLQSLSKESHSETRRLASAIDTLNSDRDRLYSRVNTLEQSLDSVTGAIAKQATAPAAVPPASVAAAPPASVSPPPGQPAVAAPAVAPVATTQPAPADKTVADKAAAIATDKHVAADKAADKKIIPASKPQTPSDRLAMTASDTSFAAAASAAPAAALPFVPPTPEGRPAVAAAVAASPDDAKPEIAPPAPLMPARSILAPPDPSAGSLIGPVKPPASTDASAAGMTKEATVTPAKDASKDAKDPPKDAPRQAPKDAAVDDANAAKAPIKAEVQHTEFGVDLGGANSVNGLRALWRGLLRSRANAQLAELQPIVVIRESPSGSGMQLRLVAGPFKDAGAAAKVCAGLSLNQRGCETATYDGQRLALKADEEPADDKGAQPRRRLAPRRQVVAPPPVVEEKKPEQSAFSSFFHRNTQ
jgi:hypothetical protein